MGLKGHKAHIRRLRALQALSEKEIGQALFVAGELIESEAKGSIMRGSASGQSGGKHQHVRSLPGQPPMNETGRLHDNIETTQPAPLRVRVSSNAPYSAPLEFGTSKMAARPFMRPARDKMKPQVQALVQRALNRAVRRSRSNARD